MILKNKGIIIKPIIILGAPRSGTTILKDVLSLHPDLWHLPAESHSILEGPFHPFLKGYKTNCVTKDDICDDNIIYDLKKKFYKKSINLNKVLKDPSFLLTSKSNNLLVKAIRRLIIHTLGIISCIYKPPYIRFLEKTPKNSLRIPLLTKIFPDALFIYLTREAPENIDSLIAGWYKVEKFGPFKRKPFATYPIADKLNLTDYNSKWWNFVLIPGWQNLKSKTVADIAALQYYECNKHIIENIKFINPSHLFIVKYENFTINPLGILHEILKWADLSPNKLIENFVRKYVRISRKKLYYPTETLKAIERLPSLKILQKEMGY